MLDRYYSFESDHIIYYCLILFFVAAFSYACLYNYLDLPVAILPITKENEEDQLKLETEYEYNDLICKLVKKVPIHKQYLDAIEEASF